MMTSREAILERIRGGLAERAAVELPPVAEVWPKKTPSRDEMAGQFATELAAISGESFRFRSMTDARAKLRQLLDENGWQTLAVMDRPVCRELVAELPPERVLWPQSAWTPVSMADVPVSLLAAECLLADTGSAIVGCDTPEERLLCYLPPACIIVGRTEQLAEHLPAAWVTLAERLTIYRLSPAQPGDSTESRLSLRESSAPFAERKTTEADSRGEYVIITGPSRTADIEKVLILGVHGPRRLVVLLVD
jgi:L-lactate dehydrogenase complex protein LldG